MALPTQLKHVFRELWSSRGAAIGKRIRETTNGTWREVVGVVTDVHDEAWIGRRRAMVYWPILMKGFEGNGMGRSLAFVVCSSRAGSDATDSCWPRSARGAASSPPRA